MGADTPGDLRRYYASRAPEYEAIYDKPERQAELAWLRSHVADFARGRRVLEVACGTGYWTAQLAHAARSVLATDVTDEVLALARARGLPSDVVTFAHADAFRLDAIAGTFDAAFAGFWWSHIPRADGARFLAGLHGRLTRPARVLLLDNRYVEGSSTPISRADDAGDTYQQRRLADGTTHEVLKNFPSAGEVRQVLEAAGAAATWVRESTHFWHASYDLA
jgi:demethylmenaquinone methyltransferase/2-methoxy-6-polyprenyl-1,4-benzoquinol methylase